MDKIPYIILPTPQEMDDLLFALAELNPKLKQRLREDLINPPILYTTLLDDFTYEFLHQFQRPTSDSKIFTEEFIVIIYKYWKMNKDDGPLSVRNLIKGSFFEPILEMASDSDHDKIIARFPWSLRRAYKGFGELHG